MDADNGFDAARFRALLNFQDGTVSRRQAIECGATPAQLRRWLSRRDLVVVFPGVYVEHNGPLTRRQREWAAVLDAEPAALSHGSALRQLTGAAVADGEPVHLIVDRQRKVVRRPGVVVHRDEHFAEKALLGTRPPRERTVAALLDLAALAPTPVEAVAILTDAVGARHTTADRLLVELAGRSRIPRRAFLLGVLRDIRDGTCSVLEHGYLTRVERPHRLPKPQRQAPTEVGRPGFRDADYEKYGIVVELDGRAGHSDARSRDRDLQRDLDAAVDADRRTLRVGFAQVFGWPCRTGRQLARAFTKGGWTGTFHECPRCTAR